MNLWYLQYQCKLDDFVITTITNCNNYQCKLDDFVTTTITNCNNN